jgi:signal peptidase complex subunit 2
MAKKKSAKVQAVPVAETDVANTTPKDDENNDGGTDDDGGADEHELELLQVELGDMIKLKQVMDETAAAALLEYLPEDYAWDNTKLWIMFVACCFAMVAQFAPVPFPDSRPILGFCGSAYFILSGVLQAIAIFIDSDSILWTKPLSEEEFAGTKEFHNKDLLKYGIQVRSSMPRFSEFFAISIQFHISGSKDPAPFVTQKWSIGQFFDKEGYFDEVGLTMEIDKLFDRFDQGKYDKPEDKMKSD